MSESIRFPTKIAILLRDDMASWQRLNVAAFLASAIAGSDPTLTGEDYLDADETRYLPMFRQPVMIFAGDRKNLTTAHRRALSRKLPVAIFTEELFKTGNDHDNRAAVRDVATNDLNLVGLAVHGPKNTVDKTLRGAHLHD